MLHLPFNQDISGWNTESVTSFIECSIVLLHLIKILETGMSSNQYEKYIFGMHLPSIKISAIGTSLSATSMSGMFNRANSINHWKLGFVLGDQYGTYVRCLVMRIPCQSIDWELGCFKCY